jgi:DNA-binding NarL/FixJ family response regulator
MARQSAASADQPVGVLVVDDQLVFRHAAREVIEAMSDFVLLGEATSGEHALAAVEDLHPDLVLLDVRMHGMDGIETSRQLRSAHPDAVVVLISVDEPLNLPAEVGMCGAADFVRKSDFRPGVLRRIWQAHGSRIR